MDTKAKREGSLSGIVAGRIRSATSLGIDWVVQQDVQQETGRQSSELHMEPVSQSFNDSDAPCATHTDGRREYETAHSNSARVVESNSRQFDVIMEEALEVVALPSAKPGSQSIFGAVVSDGSNGTESEPETAAPSFRKQAHTSVPKATKNDRDFPKMNEILKRTLSLRLHRYPSPLKLLDGVDIDNKSYLSTQPSTDCGTKIESIECKVLDPRVKSSALSRLRSKPPGIRREDSKGADASDDRINPIVATSDDKAPNELDILNVLTFIEVDVEEADWEETGVSAMTAGSSSCFGDTASSRRAVEGVPRSHKSTNHDSRRVLAMNSDAQLHSDLVAFLEASAVPNDPGLPQVRPTGTQHSLVPPTMFDTRGAGEESKEFTYEDAVIIRDESHTGSESCIHFSCPMEESPVFDDWNESLLGVEISNEETSLLLAPNAASGGVTISNVDSLSCNGSALANANAPGCEYEIVSVDDNDLLLELEAVEVLHSDDTTTLAKVGALQSENDANSAIEGIGSDNEKLDDAPAEIFAPTIASGSLDLYTDVKIKGICDGTSSVASGAVSSDLEQESARSPLRNQNVCQNLDRNNAPNGARYLDVPTESFELSPTGNVLNTEGASYDDDSELAVIGQAISSASSDASNNNTAFSSKVESLKAENVDAVTKPLRSLTQAGKVPHLPSPKSSFASSRPKGGAREKDAAFDDIRCTLAVNGERDNRNFSLQLHGLAPRKTTQDFGKCAELTSFSLEALADDDDSSGKEEHSRNEESEPLIPRTLIDDALIQSKISDLVDLNRCAEPECEPAFENLCVSELLVPEPTKDDPTESKKTSAVPFKQTLSTIADHMQREQCAGVKEKKEEESSSALESSCVSSQYPVRALSGGSFYERRKTTGYGSRPLYDEEFTWGFLHGMMSAGVKLLYIQAASENRSGSFHQQAVTMVVEPGSNAPRLDWTTIGPKPSANKPTSTIRLLDIHSIQVYNDDEQRGETANHFSVSSQEGVVHTFQAGSTYDRDMVVHGVRNLIAWLCFHLAAGDASASSMLDGDGDDSVVLDLPTAFHRIRQMNNLTNAMLD